MSASTRASTPASTPGSTPASTPASTQGARAPTRADCAAPHVLLVDDHDAARESIADALRQGGYAVDTVSSAVEALQRLPSAAYDCIITDLQMHGMDGLEFLQRLACVQRGVPVVMITAHASVPTAVEAMRRGAFDYLEKPFDVDQLEDVVCRAVARARAADAVARVPGPMDGDSSRPLGSPICAVQSPTMSITLCPSSWNWRSFLRPTTCPR